MRILLVNAIDASVEVEKRYPSLGLAHLASFLRRELGRENVELRIIAEDVPATVQSWQPDLVGISSVSKNFHIAARYANLLGDRGIPAVLGGVHVSSLPESLPRSAIAGCIGEGECTFTDLVRGHLDGGLTPEHLATIPGICYWQGDQLHLTEPRHQIADLDSLPMPARDLLTVHSHADMFTSRGCPYRCRYCCSTRFWDSLRFFSAEYVVNEIELLYRDYGVRIITFFDDLFVAKISRIEEIVHLLEDLGLLGKIRFSCHCRANLVKPQLVDLLKRRGVVDVSIGLESCDAETLRFLKGENMRVEDNQMAVDLLTDAGIAVLAYFIIGSPRETREQILRTYDFIRHSRLKFLCISVLTPFPGTPVWDYAKERGLIGEDFADWPRLSVSFDREPERAIVLSEVLQRDELVALYRKFRRLRTRLLLMNAWSHPMRRDLPRIAWNMTKAFFSSRGQRNTVHE